MGRFRRRKPAVAWLPHVTHNEQAQQVGWWSSSITVAAAANTITTSIFSLVPDYPAEAVRATGALPSLADFEESGYRLRRIVGKCFASALQTVTSGADSRPENILVGAGFMVLRVEESTGAPLVATANHYSPLDNDATRDPWIWRRTWMLENSFSNQSSDTDWPRSTPEYGSVYDGPHIDAKTARRISAEERLFFIVSTVNVGDTATIAGSVFVVLDYRVLASPLKVMGNRRNASR